MILFREDIYPNTLDFYENDNDIVNFENGDFDIRSKIQPETEVSLSFVLNQEEYDYFELFFKAINLGVDNFEANWRGSVEEYSISSDISISYNTNEKNFYNLSFNAYIVSSECTANTFNLISTVEKNINLLKGKQNYYEANIECSDIIKMLILSVEKNIRILKGEQ